jgi:hypothetical protein
MLIPDIILDHDHRPDTLLLRTNPCTKICGKYVSAAVCLFHLSFPPSTI